MKLRTDFATIDEERKYLREQLHYWKNEYPVSGLISGLVRMTSIRTIEKRLNELRKA